MEFPGCLLAVTVVTFGGSCCPLAVVCWLSAVCCLVGVVVAVVCCLFYEHRSHILEVWLSFP